MNQASMAFGGLQWRACRSALQLDRWLGAELPAAEAADLEQHVASCVRCAEAVRTLRDTHAEELPPLTVRRLAIVPRSPPAAPAGRSWWPRWTVAGVGAGVALAASLVLFLRVWPPPAQSTGIKGSGVDVAMYVRHEGTVRRAFPDEAVAPGDAIRFAVTTPETAYVAILSVDPAGHASVYYPIAPRAAAVGPGRELPLPLSTQLDATLGEERVWALFCTSPVELEPLRKRLEERPTGPAVPTGCKVSAWRFVKE